LPLGGANLASLVGYALSCARRTPGHAAPHAAGLEGRGMGHSPPAMSSASPTTDAKVLGVYDGDRSKLPGNASAAPHE